MSVGKMAAIAGIVLNLAGVFLLFRYGMPYRIETGGDFYITAGARDEKLLRDDARFRVFGKIGLFLIATGSTLQVAAILLA